MKTDLETADLLKMLCETPGISGYEMPVRDMVVAQFRRYTEHVSVDKLGNVLALKQGVSTREPRPRIMLAAHLDEIGLIVTALEKGFIRFSTVGGFDQRVLLGQQVVVHGRRSLPGVIGAPPPHITSPDQRREVPDIHELFIDVGATESELKEFVQVGDLITLERPLHTLAGDAISAKALDDRAGVAVVLLTFDLLASQSHAWDVYGVATVQEEVGLYGAETSAFALYPDLAIAIDVTFAATPGVDPGEAVTMGKGPAISFGPNIHPAVYERLVNTAKRIELPYQIQAEPGYSGTDAWAIQVARGGVPTGLIGIPLKYMHTSVETVSRADVERAARLLAAFVSSLSDSFLDELVLSS